MDYLRSCYRASMRFAPGGRLVDVDWYFGEDGDPLFGHSIFGSLNWQKGQIPPGDLGELTGGARPYRKGGIPDVAALFGVPLGNLSWYVTGAPADPTSPWPITFFGARAAQQGPAGFPAGIFPPFPGNSNPVTLTWTEHIVGQDTFTPGFEYNWHSLGLYFTWAAKFDQGLTGQQTWDCWPAVPFLSVSNDARATNHPLRCLDWDGLHTSHWDDPLWGIMPGRLTMVTH